MATTSPAQLSPTLLASHYRVHTRTMALNTNGKRPASASWDHEEHARKIQGAPKSILKRTPDGTAGPSGTCQSPQNDGPLQLSNFPNGVTRTTMGAARETNGAAAQSDSSNTSSLDTKDLSPNASPGWANLFNWPKEEKSEEQRLAEDAEWLARDKLWGPLRVSLLKHCPDWGK